MSYFTSKYPILCVPMNQVSDVNLACSVHNAGAFPSLSCYNYYKQGKLHLETFFNSCKDFSNRTGSTDILLSISWEDFLLEEVQNFLTENNYRYTELFHRPHDEIWPSIERIVSALEKQDFHIIFKILKIVKPIEKYSAIILKGPDGAGRTINSKGTLEENFNFIREKYPDKIIIPSGGIGTSEQVKQYLDAGADAIGIGTLFAASEDSCVAPMTKQKMINSDTNDLSKFGPLITQGIVFRLDSVDDSNMTRSLSKGVHRGNSGAMFAGNSINEITKILPVKDIIDKLIN